MKFRTVFSLLFFTAPFALALPTALSAADSVAEEEHGHDDESPLHKAMEDMGRAMRAVNKGLNAADPAAVKADVLEALQTMQTLAVGAKVLVPHSIEEIPEAERPARLASYRADLAGAIVTLLELERAVLADNWEQARTLYAQVRTHRKEGHEQYNPDEEN